MVKDLLAEDGKILFFVAESNDHRAISANKVAVDGNVTPLGEAKRRDMLMSVRNAARGLVKSDALCGLGKGKGRDELVNHLHHGDGWWREMRLQGAKSIIRWFDGLTASQADRWADELRRNISS